MARNQFTKLDEAIIAYIISTTVNFQGIQDVVVKVEGHENVDIASQIRKLLSATTDYHALQVSRTTLINFLDQTPHKSSKGGQIMFNDEGARQKYKQLVKVLQYSYEKVGEVTKL